MKKETPKTKKQPTSRQPAKKPAQKSWSNSKGSSLNRALQTKKRVSRMADQIIDNANIANPSGKSLSKDLDFFGKDKLRIIFFGGQDGIGEKNMMLLEYDQDALIIDCGIELGLDLPGVNYAICDFTYLEKIKKKLKGYVLTHGHLDHIGALPYIMPQYPAPVYGSSFTIGMVKKVLSNFPESAALVETSKFYEMKVDNHERLLVGKSFYVELVRVTHSIPQSTCVVVDTPLGRIVNTGDFRLDPEPLDLLPADTKRLKALGDEGVLMLLSESTNAQKPGRVPTEHTLQASFSDIIKKSQRSRIFVVSFSSNINRIQMIINAAAAAGRKIAIDGRSMIQHIELAIRMGLIKVPKNTLVTLAELAGLPDEQILMLCTGGQGEIGASLQRMSIGEHRSINLRQGDVIVVSSMPIPGNEVAYEKIGDDLVQLQCRLYRAPTWEIDGAVGPLHVSGHGCREEHREMLELLRPRYFVPIYAGALHRGYHAQIGQETGLKKEDIFMVNNGDMLVIDRQKRVSRQAQLLSGGSTLIDDSGQVIPSVVIKDRLLLTTHGLVVIVLIIGRQSGQLVTSPDIITRGFIYIRDNEELMNVFRNELKRAVSQRFKRIPLERFKVELKDHATHFLYNQTQKSPIVIPVINVVNENKSLAPKPSGKTSNKVTENHQQLVALRNSIRKNQVKSQSP